MPELPQKEHVVDVNSRTAFEHPNPHASPRKTL